LTFSVSSFIKSDRHNFIANNEWSPIHPTSILWTIRFGENVAVLLQAATKAKKVPKFTEYRCTLADLVCLARVIDNAVKDNRNDSGHVCQPAVENLNM